MCYGRHIFTMPGNSDSDDIDGLSNTDHVVIGVSILVPVVAFVCLVVAVIVVYISRRNDTASKF